MSCGERSCIHFARSCPLVDKNKPFDMYESMFSCNVNCPEYEHDGKTKPDTDPMINFLEDCTRDGVSEKVVWEGMGRLERIKAQEEKWGKI